MKEGGRAADSRGEKTESADRPSARYLIRRDRYRPSAEPPAEALADRGDAGGLDDSPLEPAVLDHDERRLGIDLEPLEEVRPVLERDLREPEGAVVAPGLQHLRHVAHCA